MAETTPMQLRMNDAYDRLRQALGRMYPDKAEQARSEVIVIMTMLTLEARLWEGKTDRLPLYPEGQMFEALAVDMPIAYARELAHSRAGDNDGSAIRRLRSNPES